MSDNTHCPYHQRRHQHYHHFNMCTKYNVQCTSYISKVSLFCAFQIDKIDFVNTNTNTNTNTYMQIIQSMRQIRFFCAIYLRLFEQNVYNKACLFG